MGIYLGHTTIALILPVASGLSERTLILTGMPLAPCLSMLTVMFPLPSVTSYWSMSKSTAIPEGKIEERNGSTEEVVCKASILRQPLLRKIMAYLQVELQQETLLSGDCSYGRTVLCLFVYFIL